MKDIKFDAFFTDTNEQIFDNWLLSRIVREYIDDKRPDFRKRPIKIIIKDEGGEVKGE